MAQADKKPCTLHSLCVAAGLACEHADLVDLRCYTAPLHREQLTPRVCRNKGVQDKVGRYTAEPCLLAWWEPAAGPYAATCPRCGSQDLSMTPPQVIAAVEAWA